MNKKSLQTIACVDDEADILEIVKMSLETVGAFDVQCYLSGKELLNGLTTYKPDVILLDVMMPESDGITILKQLRKNHNLNHIPVVLMTARVQPSEVVEYLDLGASGVIEKPFDPMKLPKQVSEAWEKYNGKIK